jgi:hypothetical protein
MSTPDPALFTAEDAQMIVDAAQKAPLPNLEHASRLSGALERFVAFCDAVSLPERAP